MKTFERNSSYERAMFPTALDYFCELDKRSALDDAGKDERRRLEAGYVGEQFVGDAIKEFGASHWIVLPNLWLEFNGHFECDLVVMTSAGIYTFEVKNYSGHFEFRNMQCRLNGDKIGFNAISQAQNSYINLEMMVRGTFPRVNVYGSLVFAGQHNTVKVHDEVSDITVVMRNELRNYIWDMVKQERMHQGPRVDFAVCINLFERYETKNPYLPDPITDEMNARVRKGVCCSHCDSFDIEMRNSYAVCNCGMHEPRENAIVRTICEYGVIHFDKELVTSEVLTFFGGSISRTNLLFYLKKHFKRTGRNKGAKFENNQLPFAKRMRQFKFTKPSYFVFSS